jgi:hypothetical protein
MHVPPLSTHHHHVSLQTLSELEVSCNDDIFYPTGWDFY